MTGNNLPSPSRIPNMNFHEVLIQSSGFHSLAQRSLPGPALHLIDHSKYRPQLAWRSLLGINCTFSGNFEDAGIGHQSCRKAQT